jgi:hypothetical protein
VVGPEDAGTAPNPDLFCSLLKVCCDGPLKDPND